MGTVILYSKISSRKWLKLNFFFEVDFFLRKENEDFESLWRLWRTWRWKLQSEQGTRQPLNTSIFTENQAGEQIAKVYHVILQMIYWWYLK